MLWKRELPLLINVLLLLSCLFVYSACVTVPLINSYQEGTFSSKMRITNIKEQKSFIFNLDIFAKKPSLLRLEITTPIGFHVASLTLQENQVTLFVPSKKIYRQSAPHTQIFEDVISLTINPLWIIPILFEEPQSDWVCDFGQAERINECKIDSFTITWTKRMGHKKTLIILSEIFEVTIYIQDFKPYLPSDSKLFVLPKVPRASGSS